MVSKEQEQKMVEETKMLVDLFLETEESDIDLEKRTGISSSTVGRRLTNKKRIIAAYGLAGEVIYEKVMNIRKNNLQKGKIIGGQTSMLNNAYTKDNSGKFSGNNTRLRLDVIYDNEAMRMKFLFHLALTFRAKTPLLADLFQIDEKELLTNLVLVSGKAYSSLLYLLYHDNSDQELARENIISYYRELLHAIRKKDTVLQTELINSITDSKISEIKKIKKKIEEYSLDELEALVNYQIKYSLSPSILASTFDIEELSYIQRLEELFEINPQLKEKYEALTSTGESRKSGGRNA